ncbi:MAG TPA: hypothetical protein VFI84_00895 [Candidatus Saccharimonadales bacterium]|nr:hypothetical protein [Candidatus Saccharimonadales bacterium]
MKQMFGTMRRHALVMGATTVTAVCASMLTASPALAETAQYMFSLSYPGATGHIGPARVGIAALNGKLGFCPDPGKTTPNGTIFVALDGSTPGIKPAMIVEAARGAYEVKRLWTSNATTSEVNKVAAKYGWAIWLDTGNSKIAAYYNAMKKLGKVSASFDAQIQAVRNEAKHVGTYTEKVQLTKTVNTVGLTGTGTVTLLHHDGTAASGDPVTVNGSRVKIVSVNGHSGNTGTTNAKGQANFVYKLTDLGTPKVNATTQVPSWRKGFVSNASGGAQRLLVGSYESVGAWAAYTAAPNGGTFVTSCSTSCNGIATVMYTTAKLPSGAAPLRYTIKNNTAVVKTGYVTAGTQKTWKLKAADSSTLVVYACKVAVVGGKCTGTTVKVGTPFLVFCPAAPVLTVSFGCPCNGKVTMTGNVKLPASVRAYNEATSVSNNQVSSMVLKTNFDNALKSASVDPGATVSINIVAQGGGHTRTWTYTFTAPAVTVTTT